ncbi:MAG: helix-turn-helix domain-containing protein [Prevotella sp.]|nr:helix-turn-helix domain-containing protein [Prevotella sp.]
MKQKYLVIVLLGLIVASGATSLRSYQATERLIEDDMSQALASALAEQQNDVISADTIRVFNSHLQLEQLRGHAVLAVDTRQKGFKCVARCSTATIFAMSDQRPASILWMLTLLWAGFCFYRYRRQMPLLAGMCQYGGLNYAESEGRFYDAEGRQVKLTPMQQQLMEMFFRSSSHSLTKTEICDALWPKKPDASETLYTLIRRIKPIIEAHSDLKIESDRGKAYELTLKATIPSFPPNACGLR